MNTTDEHSGKAEKRYILVGGFPQRWVCTFMCKCAECKLFFHAPTEQDIDEALRSFPPRASGRFPGRATTVLLKARFIEREQFKLLGRKGGQKPSRRFKPFVWCPRCRKKRRVCKTLPQNLTEVWVRRRGVPRLPQQPAPA